MNEIITKLSISINNFSPVQSFLNSRVTSFVPKYQAAIINKSRGTNVSCSRISNNWKVCVCAEERDKFCIALFIYQPSFSIGNKAGKRKMTLLTFPNKEIKR